MSYLFNLVPINEIEFSFSRSGGKGGQNVNKVASKVTGRWAPRSSRAFSTIEKERIFWFLKWRLNKNGELVVNAEEERDQFANKKRVISKINKLVGLAVQVAKKRVATKPTKGSKIRKFKEKTHRSIIKLGRRLKTD